MKPITPQEAHEARVESIPSFVIRAINSMLSNRYKKGHQVNLNVTEVKAAILAEMEHLPFSSEITWNKDWLDFEEVFRRSGWSVEYDQPGYHETYEGFYTFKAK